MTIEFVDSFPAHAEPSSVLHNRRGAAVRPSESSQTLVLTCSKCGRTLGHVVNYGRPQGGQVSLPCPCGGASHPIRVAALYKSVPDGALAESAFGPGLERAIETARRRNGGL